MLLCCDQEYFSPSFPGSPSWATWKTEHGHLCLSNGPIRPYLGHISKERALPRLPDKRLMTNALTTLSCVRKTQRTLFLGSLHGEEQRKEQSPPFDTNARYKD